MMAAGWAEERPEREHNGEQASPVESQENSVCTQGRTAPFAASLLPLFGPGAFAPSVGSKTFRNGAACPCRRRRNDRAGVAEELAGARASRSLDRHAVKHQSAPLARFPAINQRDQHGKTAEVHCQGEAGTESHE